MFFFEDNFQTWKQRDNLLLLHVQMSSKNSKPLTDQLHVWYFEETEQGYQSSNTYKQELKQCLVLQAAFIYFSNEAGPCPKPIKISISII